MEISTIKSGILTFTVALGKGYSQTEVASLEKLVSTNVSASDLIVGDFSNLFLGVRRSLIVESSAVAGGAFQKYGLAFRAVIRADWQVARPKSFALCTQDISGIPM